MAILKALPLEVQPVKILNQEPQETETTEITSQELIKKVAQEKLLQEKKLAAI
jgi:hypothetical protein